MTGTPSTDSHPSSGKVDVLIAGAGTGGTITGLSRAVKKKHNKDCIVVGVDPVRSSISWQGLFVSHLTQKGSILAYPDELNTEGAGDPYVVEGIGYDFIPDVLSRDPVDVNEWLKTSDEEAFAAVRLLMRHEGLLVGGSSGSALSGALRWLRSDQGRAVAQTKGANVVILLPDGCVSDSSLSGSLSGSSSSMVFLMVVPTVYVTI